MEPAAFAHWRRWQVPLRRAAIFRLSAIACWLPLADNRKHHTRASPEKAGALKLRPGASIYRLLHCTSLLVAQSGHFAAEFQCPLLGVKRTLIGRAPMSTSDPKRTLTDQGLVCICTNSPGSVGVPAAMTR